MLVFHKTYKDRDFHIFLENVSLHLQKYYGAILVEPTNSGNGNYVTINDISVNILDCELAIYDQDTDVLKAISFSDMRSNLCGHMLERNKETDLLLCSQQSCADIWAKESKLEIVDSIYIPCHPHISYDDLYIKRSLTKEFVDQMIFRGNVNDAKRGSVKYLENNQYFSGHEQIEKKEYLEELTKYKIGLSVPGIGELCYRDVEYLAVGIPMLRFEYLVDMNPKLIPNYHYISIPRIDCEYTLKNKSYIAVTKEREGGQKYAEEYLKRFIEIKEDRDFLDFVSKNGRDYYCNYLQPSKRIDHVLKLLKIN